MAKKRTDTDFVTIERALQTALKPVHPPRDLLDKLQSRIKDMSPAARSLPVRIIERDRPNLTFLGLAGLFTLLMTLAVGFRTAGSIVGVLALMNELNLQIKTRKTGNLRPTG